MPVVDKIQHSFSSGELSPSLYSRTDLNRYATGLRKCKNMFCHPHGGVSNRPGLKYVATSKDSTKACRLVKFIFSTTQAYVLEFGEKYVRFYKSHAQIAVGTPTGWLTSTPYVVGDYVLQTSVKYYCLVAHTSGTFATDLAAGKWVALTVYQVPTPYLEADLAELKFERSADVIYIFHPDYQTRTLSRYGDADWEIEEFSSDDGPFMIENLKATTMTVSAVTGTANVTTSAAVFDADHVGALWKLTHYMQGQSVTTAFTGTANSTSIACFTTWRVISHGTWTGKIQIQKSTDAGSTWTLLREFSSADDFNVDTYGTEDIEANPDPFLVRVRCSAFTSGTINVDLSSDPFYQNGIIRILTVTNSTAATVTVLTAIGSTAATSSWSEGSWSDVNGYPSAGTFHQDRFCTAATNEEPMTVWMSQTGVYNSYRVNSTVLDTDAISVRLLSRQLNAVNNMVSLGDIIALTSASEWKMGADKTTLTPSSIYTRVQSYRGSASVTPVIIGSQMIYVQSNGTVIRNFGYDYSIDSYTGVDLRILSEHLFTGYEIVDMDYQQDNDSLVWCVRDDGILLSLTYMSEQDVIAWSWHETDGEVESICVIPASGYDELWMVVKRGSSRFIEYMPQRMASTDPQDQYFVDCGLSYDNPKTISGATKANPVVITATSHGFSNGDYVDISDVVGMTELNGNRYKVANKTDHTFKLTEEDSNPSLWVTETVYVLNNYVFHASICYKCLIGHTAGVFATDLTAGKWEVQNIYINGSAFTTYVSGGEAREAYTTFGGTGLTHLNGLTVAILGNGEVYPRQVVTGNEITLSRACSKVHIGLPYTSDLETLNVELGLRSGTMQGKVVKISNVTFRLLNTRGGWLGPNEDNLYEAFTPERLRLGTAPVLFSGDIRQGLGAGYEDGGRIFYRQIDPLPVTISAVIPEITV